MRSRVPDATKQGKAKSQAVCTPPVRMTTHEVLRMLQIQYHNRAKGWSSSLRSGEGRTGHQTR